MLKTNTKIQSEIKMVVRAINYIPLGKEEDRKKIPTKRKIQNMNNSYRAKFPKYDFDCTMPGMIRFHKEIVKYIKDISPKNLDYKKRQQIVDRISNVVHSLWPQAKVDIFGSSSTGLFLPTSDLDIVIFGQWKRRPLHTLCNALVLNGITLDKNAIIVDKAIVPIIKIIDKQSKIKVDISFNLTNGLISASLIKKYIEEFPLLKPLVMILKQFLLERDLNEVYRGGVGSYTLTLMVVNFLQMHARNEGTLKDVNIGVFLMEFFELYGLNFNYKHTQIRPKGSGKYSKRNAFGKFSLSIIDPICEDNDVAQSTYKMAKVQMAFRHAYKALCNIMADIETKTYNYPKGILTNIINVNGYNEIEANHKRSYKQ